jgi:hypothetical protein
MRRGIGILALALALCASAKAEPPKGGWWCSFHDETISTCWRVRQNCERSRRRWNEDQARHGTGIIWAACRAQPKAAVFSFFDRLQGYSVTHAKVSFRSCEAYRAHVLEQSEDYTNVSHCAPHDGTGLSDTN